MPRKLTGSDVFVLSLGVSMAAISFVLSLGLGALRSSLVAVFVLCGLAIDYVVHDLAWWEDFVDGFGREKSGVGLAIRCIVVAVPFALVLPIIFYAG